MENEERKLIREIFMARASDIEPLAKKAIEKYGIKFDAKVVDGLIYIRTREIEGFDMHPLVQYGFLLRICKECNWQLGVTAIQEAIDTYIKAEKNLHKITQNTGKKIIDSIEGDIDFKYLIQNLEPQIFKVIENTIGDLNLPADIDLHLLSQEIAKKIINL